MSVQREECTGDLAALARHAAARGPDEPPEKHLNVSTHWPPLLLRLSFNINILVVERDVKRGRYGTQPGVGGFRETLDFTAKNTYSIRMKPNLRRLPAEKRWMRPVRLGALSAAIPEFSPRGKELAECQLRKMIDRLIAQGLLACDSFVLPGRVFGPHQARVAAETLAASRVDAVLILNSAFPNGYVFATIAADPYLARIPIILAADAEPDLGTREWTTNAWCGVIMNNHVARRINRPVALVGGDMSKPGFGADLEAALRACRAVAALRRTFIGRIGDAPGGFHSATGDQLRYLERFGVQVDTVDLSAVLQTMRTRRAEGFSGAATFTDDDVRATVRRMCTGRKVSAPRHWVEKAALLYHALKATVEANGYDAVSFRCWPEVQSDIMPFNACLSISWLMSEGVVAAAACEGDWPTAVAQLIGAHITGRPAACLDFVNHTASSDIVQLGHCGVGIAGCMACEEIAEHTVARQADKRIGPALIGQFEYGPKTGINMIETPSGDMKMLAFCGSNAASTARGLKYAAADIRLREYRSLHQTILRHGFSHHLAVAMWDCRAELRVFCALTGVELVEPGG